jgi:hypothetical protein
MSGESLARFVRSLYFDMQRIDGVSSLEIWNGLREFDDPREQARLVKNLYKITVPLVNEEIFGRPFETHAMAARDAVGRLIAGLSQDGARTFFEGFPDPPVRDADQKRVYAEVKSRALREVRAVAQGLSAPAEEGLRDRGAFPDGVFDFREMRIVDNELPYIIFTDKEFRVIHGIAIVYLWLLDLDALFLATLAELGTEAGLAEEYRKFTRQVQKENPLTVKGRKMDSRELVAHIQDKLAYEDYLDVFENVYRWWEKTREKFSAE